jgi:hypothetical protein
MSEGQSGSGLFELLAAFLSAAELSEFPKRRTQIVLGRCPIPFGQHRLQHEPQFFGAGHRFLQLVEKRASVRRIVKYHDIAASSSRGPEACSF